MSTASFMLRSVEQQYRHQMDKLVKNKFRPIPQLIEMFNFNSKQAKSGYGFPYYSDLIVEAWHPVVQAQNHKIVVWDVAYFFSDIGVNTETPYKLTIGNKMNPNESITESFSCPEDRLEYAKKCQIFFNYENNWIHVKTPSLQEIRDAREEKKKMQIKYSVCE